MSRLRTAMWRAGGPIRLGLIGLVRVYRVTLAGLLGGQCRFYPSCSEYAMTAIRNVGAIRGTVLAAWRVLRCSPLTPGGVDRPPGPHLRYDGVIRQDRPSRGSP